ncbi:hypothetical protein [Motiliproteus sp. SC1-56]|uniref:hypothetical protein n=1 Tax=Motiliproteus sp. SC1-56 TaxID=2799565 RepID=UPI001A8E867D|nr:hypothetical protein [Motiliproteus sp. SC1-56]
MTRALRTAAAGWGLLGISVFFLWAIYRLSLIALQAFEQPLAWYHWLGMAAWVFFMSYGEGYRGFQKGFSPRVAARIAYLYRYPGRLRALLAPVFCMGYFHIERRRQVVTFMLTLMIIGLVQLVHFLEQPWRGIVDLGVVIGLSWGLISLWLFTARALTDSRYPHSPEVPAGCD